MTLKVSTVLAAMFLVTSSLVVGYSLGYNSDTIDDHIDSDPDHDEEEVADGESTAVQARALEPCKMVVVVRTDLMMTTGKIATQCGHATLACYRALVRENIKLVRNWEHTGEAKVVLKVNSQDELLRLEALAKNMNLCSRLVKQHAGRAQDAEGFPAVLGIGPGPSQLVNRVTGRLRLL